MKIGYEVSFNRYFFKPEQMRPLAEIQADILALERQTEGLLAEIMGGMASSCETKLRVYVDTSVIGGCHDEEFQKPSRRLFERFASGELTFVLSPLVLEELQASPRRVREVLRLVPDTHTEMLEALPQAERLAAKYIEQGALTPRMYPDAMHIANAAVAGVDVLVSWNFKHIVNVHRIRTFNDVNRKMGYGILDIRSPKEMEDDD